MEASGSSFADAKAGRASGGSLEGEVAAVPLPAAAAAAGASNRALKCAGGAPSTGSAFIGGGVRGTPPSNAPAPPPSAAIGAPAVGARGLSGKGGGGSFGGGNQPGSPAGGGGALAAL